MPIRSSDDLWAPLALLALGMVAPGVLQVLAGDLLALYVSAGQLTVFVAVGYGLVAWLLVERDAVDRTSFLLVSLIWPWILVFGTLMVLLLLNQGEQISRGPLADVFRTLTHDWPGFLGYGAVFTVAGVATFAVSRRYERLASRDDRVPGATRAIAIVVGLVVLVAVVVGGMNAVRTSTSSIESVGPGTTQFQDPTFNVSVAGPAAEHRVTAVAPDGTSVTERLSGADMRGGSGTVGIPIDYDETNPPGVLPVQDGVYRVRVTSLAGTTVDTATFRTEDASSASLSGVATTNGTLPWTDPPPVEYGRGSADARLGLVVENEGAFHAELSLTVAVPRDPIVVHRIFLEPGERTGVVVALHEEAVRSIRTTDGGSVTVHLFHVEKTEAPAASVELELPAE